MANKLIITGLWMVFITTLMLTTWRSYEQEQINRGQAVSRFLTYHHNLDILPADARWFQVQITTYDITVEELSTK